MERDQLLVVLEHRFHNHPKRHVGLDWERVKSALSKNPEKLQSIIEMELTDGEPDVVDYDLKTGEFTFCDCSQETPKGRVSLCYDRAGLESRKDDKPANTATDLAMTMGIEVLSEEEYLRFQRLAEFDLKTSSWIKTPDAIRKLGGALFAECRYGRIFIGHNGAQSYYSRRGFRGMVRI